LSEFNVNVRAKDATSAWEEWFNILKSQAKDGVLDPSRDGAVVGEVINAVTVIEDPTRCIINSPLRKMPIRYAVGELLWYMSANNKLDEIRKYTSAWDRMSDDGLTVNSNYGHKIHKFYGFDQWEDIKKRLTADPYSRQCVIHIKDPRPMEKPTKDTPCTVCLQFFIRDEKLYMTTYMRSNDIWMGFPYDVFNFTAMQVLMSMELGVKLGTYTHIAGSLHIYQRDLKEDKPNESTNQ
jgi:thymidylate synthase